MTALQITPLPTALQIKAYFNPSQFTSGSFVISACAVSHYTFDRKVTLDVTSACHALLTALAVAILPLE